MKKITVMIAALMLLVTNAVTAFADIAPYREVERAMSSPLLYVGIVIIAAVIAYVAVKRKKKK